MSTVTTIDLRAFALQAYGAAMKAATEARLREHKAKRAEDLAEKGDYLSDCVTSAPGDLEEPPQVIEVKYDFDEGDLEEGSDEPGTIVCEIGFLPGYQFLHAWIRQRMTGLTIRAACESCHRWHVADLIIVADLRTLGEAISHVDREKDACAARHAPKEPAEQPEVGVVIVGCAATPAERLASALQDFIVDIVSPGVQGDV